MTTHEWSGGDWRVTVARRYGRNQEPVVSVLAADGWEAESVELAPLEAIRFAAGLLAAASVALDAPDTIPDPPKAGTYRPAWLEAHITRRLSTLAQQASLADALLRAYPAAGGPVVYLEGEPMFCPEVNITIEEQPLEASPRRDEPRIGPAGEFEDGVHWIVTNPRWPDGDKPYRERCGGCVQCEPAVDG